MLSTKQGSVRQITLEIARERPIASLRETPFFIENMLSAEKRLIGDLAHNFRKENLFPHVLEAKRKESFCRKIMTEMENLAEAKPVCKPFNWNLKCPSPFL